MKIFTSAMSFVAAVALSLATPAAAKTFTVHADDASHITLTHPDTYEPIVFDADNTVSITAERVLMDIQSNPGWWIASATNDAGQDAGSWARYPSDYLRVDTDKIQEGGTLTITTVAATIKTFTVIGDPEIISVQYDRVDCTPVEGKWVITESGISGKTIRVEVKNPNNDALVRMYDQTGNEKYPSYGAISWDCSSETNDNTFTVETEKRSLSMTVNVDGDIYLFTMYRKDDSPVALENGTNAVPFAASETQFKIQPKWGESIYKVEISNGGTVTPDDESYIVTPVDGSQIDITVPYPDKEVPVSFTFINDGSEGILQGIRANYNTLTPDANGVYTVKLGTSLDVQFNKGDYNIASITANGKPVTIPGYSSTYSTIVKADNGLHFVIDATPKGKSHVTVIAENPTSMIFDGGSNYGKKNLTGTTTEFELPASVVQFYISAAEGYKTSYIRVGDKEYKAGDAILVADGMTVYCNGEEYLRDKAMTIYVQEVDEPTDFTITLYTKRNYDGLTKYISNKDLPAGYSSLMYHEEDVPMEVYSSYDLVAYLNGEKLANTSYWGNFTYNVDNVKEGDVLKLFYTEPDTYNVTYTVDSEAAVEVRHDRTLVIDNPSTHTVLAGTEIHVVPANDTDLVVKANDADLEKDAEGKYVVTVNADTNISVAPDPAAGIETITTGGISADAPVYNLQGIQVGIASDLDRLPADIYIVDGTKVKL